MSCLIKCLLRTGCLSLLFALFFSPCVSAAPVPDYAVTIGDAQWTETASKGVYEVATSNEVYSEERWERPVEGDKYTDSGGTRTSTAKYYAYSDVVSGEFGIDSNYFYAAIGVAGDFLHEPGKDEDTQGLKGKYYIYFDTGDVNEQFALQIDDASGLGGEFDDGDNIGVAKVYGPDFGNEYDGDYDLQVRANGLVVEFALDLASVGLEAADFEQVDWLFAGVAVSNPSSAADLLIRDKYSDPDGNSVEYDTLVGGPLSIPEPAMISLLSAGACVTLLLRRLFPEKRTEAE